MDRADYQTTEDALNARLEHQIKRCRVPQFQAVEMRKEWGVLTFREQIRFVEAMEAQEA